MILQSTRVMTQYRRRWESVSKQDSTNIPSWNDAGAVTVSAVSGQDLTMSGDDVAEIEALLDAAGQRGLHGYPELEQ